jgi:hypothetical protein
MIYTKYNYNGYEKEYIFMDFDPFVRFAMNI